VRLKNLVNFTADGRRNLFGVCGPFRVCSIQLIFGILQSSIGAKTGPGCRHQISGDIL